MSSLRAARSTGFQLRRCTRRVSIIASISASSTLAVCRTISSPLTSTGPISGMTSNVAVYSIWPFSGRPLVEIAGCIAGRSFSVLTASWKVEPISSESASPRIRAPKRCSMTWVGTLPGRKPLSLALRPISWTRLRTVSSRRAAGMRTVSLRPRLPTFSTETCMDAP